MINIWEWLSDKRAQHSLRVAETAVLLAKIHSCREDLAFEAGLYHDIAKEMTQDDLSDIGIQQNNLCKHLHEHYFPVWHAFIAPTILREKFGLRNRAILSAIRWHTTGRARMTTLEKIVFLADYVEPGKEYQHNDTLLRLAMKDLDKAMAKVIEATIKRVEDKGAAVHPYSKACFEYYKAKC